MVWRKVALFGGLAYLLGGMFVIVISIASSGLQPDAITLEAIYGKIELIHSAVIMAACFVCFSTSLVMYCFMMTGESKTESDEEP